MAELRDGDPRRERRCRIVSINPQSLMYALRPHLPPYRITYPDIPQDAEAVAVTASFEHGAIEIILTSAAWEPVPEGERFPNVGGAWMENLSMGEQERYEAFGRAAEAILRRALDLMEQFMGDEHARPVRDALALLDGESPRA